MKKQNAAKGAKAGSATGVSLMGMAKAYPKYALFVSLTGLFLAWSVFRIYVPEGSGSEHLKFGYNPDRDWYYFAAMAPGIVFLFYVFSDIAVTFLKYAMTVPKACGRTKVALVLVLVVTVAGGGSMANNLFIWGPTQQAAAACAQQFDFCKDRTLIESKGEGVVDVTSMQRLYFWLKS